MHKTENPEEKKNRSMEYNFRLKESPCMCVYVQSSSGLMGQIHGAFRCEVCFKDNVNNKVCKKHNA